MSGTPDERALIRLVDDDEDFLEGLAFVLEAKVWKTAGYLSPRDFLTSDRPSVPGCLILDIRMPEMSGIELQHEMKARHRSPHHHSHGPRRREVGHQNAQDGRSGLSAETRRPRRTL